MALFFCVGYTGCLVTGRRSALWHEKTDEQFDEVEEFADTQSENSFMVLGLHYVVMDARSENED